MRTARVTGRIQSKDDAPISVPETPRLFGANSAEIDGIATQAPTGSDFEARWWPADLTQRLRVAKPR